MLTQLQKEIVQCCEANGGTVTSAQLTAAFGGRYYANGAFHIGNAVRRMVANGSMISEKRGVFKVGRGSKPKPAAVDKNQTELFSKISDK